MKFSLHSSVFLNLFVPLQKTIEAFIRNGEVSEWLKEHAWKVCIPQKGIEGSNPSLSART